jgi:hypothetical protein
MDKLTTGAAYGASAGSILNGMLNAYSPEQWNAIGVLVGIIVAVLTYLTNLYFKIREDRRAKAIRALTSLFLLPLLTACGNTQTVYVPAPVVPISTDLTADTPIPGMVAPFTWQASLELNAQLYTALGRCNLDKAGIRRIESARNKLK